MASDRPPTLDPVAASHWAARAPAHSPWLHEEVGSRMEERLAWIIREPAAWADWGPVRGGRQAHERVMARYPKSHPWVFEASESHVQAAARAWPRPWWRRLGSQATGIGPVPDASVQMLWANMALHAAADPQTLMLRWHRALAVDGFLMFSCLGPDTLRELRGLYAALGWPPAAHEFTDMHDWGDMLVQVGFAEPVMDMEHITLTFETPARLLAELRELGRNLHRNRFPALRGRGWRASLERAIDARLRGADGRLALTFEVIYGHAFKPAPRAKMSGSSSVSLDDMRAMLQAEKRGRANEA